MIELRNLNRRRTFALVEIQDSQKQCNAGLVYNISRYGAFILCSNSPSLDRIIDISLSKGAGGNLSIPISGIVIHRNKYRFGLMFCNQNSPTLELVDKLSSRHNDLT